MSADPPPDAPEPEHRVSGPSGGRPGRGRPGGFGGSASPSRARGAPTGGFGAARQAGMSTGPGPGGAPQAKGRPPAPKKSGRIGIPVTVLALAGVVVAGLALAPSDPDDIAYCVDEADTVVDDSECDGRPAGSGGPRFIVIGSLGTGRLIGSRIDAADTTTRVAATDAAGRAAVGVSSSGSVKSGTSVSGKSGGFGGKLFGGSDSGSGSGGG